MKERNPIHAFIWNFFAPGLGQIYNGQIKKGLAFILYPYILFVASSTFSLINTNVGLYYISIISISLIIYTCVDTVIFARKQSFYQLKRFNKWYYYLLIVLTNIIINSAVISKYFINHKAFSISSPSNLPTLLVGDFIMAQKIKANPENIKRGDMILYKTKDNVDFIFRVIGKPMDKVEVVGDEILINNSILHHERIKDTTINNISSYIIRETLPNKKSYELLFFKNKISGSKKKHSLTLGTDEYYVMGDSRDNALDSRYSGTVNKKVIHSKAVYIYYSQDSNRIGKEL